MLHIRESLFTSSAHNLQRSLRSYRRICNLHVSDLKRRIAAFSLKLRRTKSTIECVWIFVKAVKKFYEKYIKLKIINQPSRRAKLTCASKVKPYLCAHFTAIFTISSTTRLHYFLVFVLLIGRQRKLASLDKKQIRTSSGVQSVRLQSRHVVTRPRRYFVSLICKSGKALDW